jgi:hypothetical protein
MGMLPVCDIGGIKKEEFQHVTFLKTLNTLMSAIPYCPPQNSQLVGKPANPKEEMLSLTHPFRSAQNVMLWLASTSALFPLPQTQLPDLEA